MFKIENASGDLKKFPVSEENYIAYQASLQLADAGPTGTASLNNNGSGDNVGTFTDTAFAEAIGSTNLATVTTTSTLYQTTGTAVETGSSFFKPLIATGNYDFKTANDTEFNEIIDRIISVIFTNDFPGSYQLASSSPGSDWSIAISNIFTDTRTDGTSVQYNIYKKITMTPPSGAKPARYKDNNGTFDGIQEMSNAEIKYTFGQRAKNRIIATGIGKYQLRNSTQGSPTDPGTWKTVGTATDTKQTTADVNYTRTSVGDYTRNSTTTFAAVYVGDYATTYLGNYIGDYQAAYQRAYEGNYLTNFTRDRTQNFTGNFIGNFLGNYLGDYRRAYVGDYEGPALIQDQVYNGFIRVSTAYARNYDDGTASINYTTGQSYSPDSTAQYVPNYQRNSVVDYQRNFTRTSTRDSTVGFIGNFIGNYEGAFTRISNVDYTIEYLTDFIGNYATEYLKDYEGNYVGDFLGNYLGNYVGDFLGETIQAAPETIDTYTLYVRIS